MDSHHIAVGDDFYKQCGIMFLTLKGNILFHCTLCENKYDGFQQYAEHIDQHYLNDNEKDCTISLDDNSSRKLMESDDYDESSEEHDPESIEIEAENFSNATLGEPTVKIEISRTYDWNETNEETRSEDEFVSATISRLPELLKSNETEEVKSTVRAVIQRTVKEPDGRKYKCPECEFACKLYRNLLGHMKRHSAVRPYQCSECPKAFYTRFELGTHTRSHTGERPYLCTECGRGFITAGKLGEHIKRHNNKRDKECSICDMKFYNAQLLNRHMAVHTLERYHKCESCDASFKRRTALLNHKKLHENKREYQCELCPARFNQKPGLHSHMRSKHSLARFSTQVLN